MTARAGRAAAILAVAALFAGPASGDERWHTVAEGESVSAIAKRYYGDYAFTDLLLRFNDRDDAAIRPGQRLRVPYCAVHIVKPGDTGSGLAQRYLARPSAWPVIAELNGRLPEVPLRVGERLVMPVILRHRLARGESLAALAERYYDEARRSAWLQSFNGIDDPRELAVGRVIEIPLTGLLLRETPEPKAPPAPARAAARPAEPLPAPPWFDRGMDEATRAWDAGTYDVASDRVAELAGRIDDVPSPADRARLWRLAAFVHVAFDRDEEACAAFRSLRALEPRIRLDPETVSPKIRATLAACEAEPSS